MRSTAPRFCHGPHTSSSGRVSSPPSLAASSQILRYTEAPWPRCPDSSHYAFKALVSASTKWERSELLSCGQKGEGGSMQSAGVPSWCQQRPCTDTARCGCFSPALPGARTQQHPIQTQAGASQGFTRSLLPDNVPHIDQQPHFTVGGS